MAPTTWASCFLLLPFFFYGTGSAASFSGLTRRGEITSILKSHAHTFSPDTTIYLPSSPEFFNVTERWTTFDAPTFSAAISPATEEDVVKIVRRQDIEAGPRNNWLLTAPQVKVATQHNISFLATGGRHSYTTTIQALHNGLEVDLSQLDTVKVDAAAQTLTVGPGVRVGDIFDPLYDAGLEIRKFSKS